MIYPIDHNRHHYLQLTAREMGGYQLTLGHRVMDRRSLLHTALRANLLVRAISNSSEPQILTFSRELDRVEIEADVTGLEIVLGRFEAIPLLTLKLGTETEIVEHYQLSPFETRFLAQNGFPHPVKLPFIKAPAGLSTDLHTHLTGCVAPNDLINIALAQQLDYPCALLMAAGIRVTGDGNYPLARLSSHQRELLAARLAIPLDRRITFAEMERIYQFRGPITKRPEIFLPLCQQLARDYATMGVKYLELSFSNIVQAQYLQMAHQSLPEIEAETGVEIRFLAALSRHDDLEWDLDYLTRLQQLTASRYLVGLDFMGHETNSTRAFARQLREVVDWADRARPGFVVRVHAGENPAFPENIRIALEHCRDKQVQLRIGHGLYGVDEPTLIQLREQGVMVEFNLNSNLALNNIQTSREVPIARYLAAGVAVTLGTDGYGIYQTNLELEARAALIAGLTAQDLAAIRQTEADYLARRTAADAALTLPKTEFVVPPDLPPHFYTPTVMALAQATREARNQTLLARLAEFNISLLDETGVRQLLIGKQVISVAGAWRQSWSAIAPADQILIEQELTKLLAALSIEQTILITGGTCYGVENLVQRLARARGLTVLAMLVRETPPDSLAAEAFTQAHIVGERLHDKAAGLYQLMKEHNGLCLFIGGGNIVSDEIQTAINLRLRYLLMAGPAGASSLHAQQHPAQAFTSAAQVLQALADARPWLSIDEPYWHLGANPTCDIVLTRQHPQTGELELLLIRRDDDAPTEPGKWALPGGFQPTDAPRGSQWQPGCETTRETALRELLEETTLDLRDLEGRLVYVGDYQGEGRDPRDTPQAWSRSTVFALQLPADRAHAIIAGADDACDARWWPVEHLPDQLAFDHRRIINDALKKI